MKTKMFLHEVQCVTHMWTPTTTTTTEAGQLTFQQSARMPPSKGIPAMKKVQVKCRTIKKLHQYHQHKKCVTITIEAQLPQCLQVDVFLT